MDSQPNNRCLSESLHLPITWRRRYKRTLYVHTSPTGNYIGQHLHSHQRETFTCLGLQRFVVRTCTYVRLNYSMRNTPHSCIMTTWLYRLTAENLPYNYSILTMLQIRVQMVVLKSNVFYKMTAILLPANESWKFLEFCEELNRADRFADSQIGRHPDSSMSTNRHHICSDS